MDPSSKRLHTMEGDDVLSNKRKCVDISTPSAPQVPNSTTATSDDKSSKCDVLPPSKSPLLNLPRDIFDIIIEMVIFSRREPPTSPDKTGRVDFDDMEYMAWRKKQFGTWNETGYASNSAPLLLTSHQLSAETKRVIDRLRRISRSDYVVDMSVLDEKDLYPTWLSVPWLTESIDTLHVDVRLFGRIRTCGSGGRGGGNPGVHWSFFSVLERLLRYGPVGLKKDRQNCENRNVTVNNLVINIKSAETELEFPPDREGCTYTEYSGGRRLRPRSWGPRPNLSDYAVKPEWFSQFLAFEIFVITCLHYHSRPFGQILFESIGTIQVLVEGNLQKELDLSTILMGHRPETLDFGTIYRSERDAAYREWWPTAIEQRKKLGFPPSRHLEL